MGKPESVTKKKDKPKPPVSKAAISELPFLRFTVLALEFSHGSPTFRLSLP